jgi:hypothetical protein
MKAIIRWVYELQYVFTELLIWIHLSCPDHWEHLGIDARILLMNIKETKLEGVSWIHFVQDRDQ